MLSMIFPVHHSLAFHTCKLLPLPEHIQADDSAIIYTGRIDFTNRKAPTFSHSGVNIRTKFYGTGIDIILSDTGNNNYYNVIIDNKAPIVINTVSGEKTYMIARKLKNTLHSLEIFKRTEASQGITTFLGFNCDLGKGLAPPDEILRKMEFIGDSITCGYGNELSVKNPDNFHFTSRNENAYLAFGAITARNLKARYQAVAFSGKGIFRNYEGTELETIPLIYDRIFPDKIDSPIWNSANYIPDVVVINLGTNDYSSQAVINNLTKEDFDAVFIQNYSKFIKKIRKNYGTETKIICCVGPMMNDFWPENTVSWTRIKKSVSGIVDNFNKSGDANVYYFCFDMQTSPYGEDWHPTVSTHKQMAVKLTTFIKQLTGWE
jgi:lysophospholipase L1-like esterase